MTRQKMFADHLWFEREGNSYTVGISEEVVADLSEIHHLELPEEGESVDPDTVIGVIETDKGDFDLYSPVEGTISEINSLVLDDPQIIIEDPSEGWLFRVESDQSLEDELPDDEDDEGEDFEEEEEEE